ncbi:hypothetical protein N9D31_02665 [Oligoflexaceae bacterium]|nr:hypothetical protein [Oligoflexaceae bacterium]
MGLYRILLLGLLMTCQTAFADTKYSKLVWKSLSMVYYRNTPAPPAPSSDEKDRALTALKSIRGSERQILTRFLSANPTLLSLAMRDLDRDGVKDYRVDELSGKFMEGDVDVDGDGIRNVLDSSPYDPKVGGRDKNGDGHPDVQFTDRNRNKIPDHVDWAYQKKSADLVKIQKALYSKNLIILVERDLPFSPVLVHAVYDTVTKVFRRYFAPVVPTLRTISTEKRVHLKPSQDEGVSAMMIPQTQNVYLYTDADTGAPLAKLALLVHEITHAIQFAFDYNPKRASRENARLITYPKRYFRYMSRFDWRIKPAPSKKKNPFRSIVGVWRESRPYSEYFRGRHLNHWLRWLEDGVSELGYKFLLTPAVREQHFVSIYAATDIYEWHAEAVMASVMNLMKQSPASSKSMNRDLKKTWPEFNFQNIDKSKEFLTISQELKLSPRQWKTLSKKYVR